MKKQIQKFRQLLISAIFLIFTLISQNAWSQVPEYFNTKLNINRHFTGVSKLQAKDYFQNLAHFKGFRLVGIDVVSGADHLPAQIKVSVHKTVLGQPLQLNTEIHSYRLFLTSGLFIGFGAENIILDIKGDAFVKELNLILTR